MLSCLSGLALDRFDGKRVFAARVGSREEQQFLRYDI